MQNGKHFYPLLRLSKSEELHKRQYAICLKSSLSPVPYFKAAYKKRKESSRQKQNKKTLRDGLLIKKSLKVAGVTGLEPATSGVTGRRSNQLSYTPKKVWL
jgi:hypothetical protein